MRLSIMSPINSMLLQSTFRLLVSEIVGPLLDRLKPGRKKDGLPGTLIGLLPRIVIAGSDLMSYSGFSLIYAA